MNKKMIKELLKAHCTIENGRWIFKQVDIDAASLELEQAIAAKPIVSRCLPFNGCQTCIHNKPGLEAGYWCINNCINGSMFQGK